MKRLDEQTRRQVACEAGLLLNEAIRELVIPQQIVSLTKPWEERSPVPLRKIAAFRHTALMSAVIQVYRLKETRDNFLAEWLFSEAELRTLGFPPVEEFVGKEKWKFFEIVRNQYAGHPTHRKPTKTSPGRIVPAAVLGRALRETGLWQAPQFLQRVQEELVPGVEKVRDELTRRYPEVRQFIEETYPMDLDVGKRGV